MKRLLTLSLAALLAAGLTACGAAEERGDLAAKPVLYLYPEEETEVTVTLDFDGTLTSTYPDYGDGWTVTARPGGTLTDPATGREYYCLFWEGITDAEYDFSTGFCVAGEDTAAFLEDALDRLGLTEREADEFIIYWLPKLEGNPYNLLSFQTEAYTDSAGLTIDPAPDTLIRVFMAWKGLEQPVEIPAQELTAPAALKNVSIGIGSTHGKTYIHTSGVTTNAAELFDKLPPQDHFLESMADACKAVIVHGKNGLLDDYDQIFRDLGNQTYNEETIFEFGSYGPNGTNVRTGYTNGIPTSGQDNSTGGMGKGGGAMIAMPTFYFEFDKDDQRRDVSICNYGLKLSSNGNEYQMNTFAGMGVGKYRINWKSEKGTKDDRRDINWPLLRYADVLLMYAEALNELNNGATVEAVNAVKQVRMRAFRNDEDKIGTIPTSYEDSRNYIIKERKLELSNEGLRKSDLARWGILVDYLTEEKAKLVRLCNREGEYVDVKPYRAYKLTSTPKFLDPTIALDYIEMDEDDVKPILTTYELQKLHIMNNGSSGYVEKTFYEVGDKVYYTKDAVPAGQKVEEVKYTILNMFSVRTIKQKGNLSVEEKKEAGVDENGNLTGVDVTICANNAWITGNTGIYYGMKKNMVEILPFSTTAIIDVNPGLAGQQHPCY